MPDRIALPVLALLAAGLIALALVWPLGQGAASPGPIGHLMKAEAPTPSSAATPRAAGGRATPEALRGPEPTGGHP